MLVDLHKNKKFILFMCVYQLHKLVKCQILLEKLNRGILLKLNFKVCQGLFVSAHLSYKLQNVQ